MSNSEIKIESAFFFLHPLDLCDDPDLLNVYVKVGFVNAYSIYTLLVSKLCRYGGKFPCKNIPGLLHQYQIDSETFKTCLEALESEGLILSDNETLSAPLADNNIQKRKEFVEKKRKAGEASAKKRKEKTSIQKVDEIEDNTNKTKGIEESLLNDEWIDSVSQNNRWLNTDFKVFATTWIKNKVLTDGKNYTIPALKKFLIMDFTAEKNKKDGDPNKKQITKARTADYVKP